MGIINVHGLTKSYAARPVVRGIDFSVEPGEVFGILGPNGAGKTTTVELIGGLRSRDAGHVSVAGFDPQEEPRELRGLLGMQLQESRQPAKVTVREALELYRSFYVRPRATGELLERFGLTGQAGTRFEHLSGGQQQRLSVALALVGNPRVAILDELTTGLDPAARREIWEFLRGLVDEGVTIVLVTHSMEEAEALCDRVAIIDDGRVAALDTPAVLAHNGGRTRIAFTTGRADELSGLAHLPSVLELSVEGQRISIRGNQAAPTAVLDYLTRAGVRVEGLQVSTPTLDEAYLALTRKKEIR